MSAQSTQGPQWRVSGRVGATARDGLVGLYAIHRTEHNKYLGQCVGYAHTQSDADVIARAPELAAENEALRKALADAEATLGENLQWIRDQADLGIRQKDAETLRRLKQLDEGWQRIARTTNTHPARGEDGAE